MSLSSPQLEIMKEVWRRGDATVRDVYEVLRARRPIAYTTVMTTMKTMEARGHLKKRTEGRTHVYRAVESQNRTMRRIVSDFLNRAFNGSAEPLLAHLVAQRRLSEKDLEELSRMIRKQQRPAASLED
jgi:predicted transcriptional regulator